MSAFPSSTIGLPSSVNYSLPPSLSENAKSYFVSISPDNLQEVVGSAGTGILYVANGAPLAQTPFNMSNLYFSIPGAGSSSSLFLDPSETTLSFQLQITVGGGVNLNAVNGISKVQMIGSAASWFDQLQLISNNLPIEQINNYAVLHHILLQNTCNSAERQGPMAIQMGCEDQVQSVTTNFQLFPPGLNGCELPDGTTNGTYTLNFCIPLVSMIGLEGSKAGKLFPIGMLSNLQLQLTTAQWCPLTSWYNIIPATNQARYTNIKLDNFRLGCKFIDIGDMAASMLLSSFPDGKIYLKTATYMNANVTIPSGSLGQQVLFHQIRASSVKSLYFHYANQGASTSCPNFQFDSVNPNIVNFNASINGQLYPQYNILPVQWPALAFSHVAAAFGTAGNLKSTGGSYSRSAYGIAAIAQGAGGAAPALPSPDTMIVGAPVNGQRQIIGTGTTQGGIQYIAAFPNQFLLALDLEKSASTLFQGVNSRASGINQNITIYSPPVLSTGGAAVANVTMTAYAYGYVDCVLVFDIASRSVMAFL
jgi:hypothetical protein